MISAKNLSKSFNGQEVLKQINFHIPKGSVVSLIGPSGSGKTTLLRCIHGLEKPDSGTLVVGGKTGFVFQHFNLFPHMTVLGNLTYTPIRIQKRTQFVVETEALELLACMGLEGFENRYPHQLSGGQKQRVAIARTLMTQPDILLIDEPTSALDPENKQKIIRLLHALHDAGKTIVCISHDPEFVEQFDVMALDHGVIKSMRTHLSEG